MAESIQAPEQFGDATGFQGVRVNDLVAFGNRVWQVTGVHEGASGHESVATIVACDREPPCVYGKKVSECIVPLEFLHGRVFRYVTRPDKPEGET